jgi:uncharacterized protein
MKKSFSGLWRWLHIYLSMAGFALLLFFSVTGITLNHTEWFDNMQTTVNLKGRLDTAWLRGNIDKLSVAESLRKAHEVRGAVSSFEADEEQVTVSFAGPGYAADVFIERADGNYELTETRTGIWGVMNDLHKGRDTGSAWRWLIDASAVLMILISLTGMFMLFYLKRKRLAGWLVALAGSLIAWAVYAIWVP